MSGKPKAKKARLLDSLRSAISSPTSSAAASTTRKSVTRATPMDCYKLKLVVEQEPISVRIRIPWSSPFARLVNTLKMGSGMAATSTDVVRYEAKPISLVPLHRRPKYIMRWIEREVPLEWFADSYPAVYDTRLAPGPAFFAAVQTKHKAQIESDAQQTHERRDELERQQSLVKDKYKTVADTADPSLVQTLSEWDYLSRVIAELPLYRTREQRIAYACTVSDGEPTLPTPYTSASASDDACAAAASHFASDVNATMHGQPLQLKRRIAEVQSVLCRIFSSAFGVRCEWPEVYPLDKHRAEYHHATTSLHRKIQMLKYSDTFLRDNVFGVWEKRSPAGEWMDHLQQWKTDQKRLSSESKLSTVVDPDRLEMGQKAAWGKQRGWLCALRVGSEPALRTIIDRALADDDDQRRLGLASALKQIILVLQQRQNNAWNDDRLSGARVQWIELVHTFVAIRDDGAAPKTIREVCLERGSKGMTEVVTPDFSVHLSSIHQWTPTDPLATVRRLGDTHPAIRSFLYRYDVARRLRQYSSAERVYQRLTQSANAENQAIRARWTELHRIRLQKDAEETAARRARQIPSVVELEKEDQTRWTSLLHSSLGLSDAFRLTTDLCRDTAEFLCRDSSSPFHLYGDMIGPLVEGMAKHEWLRIDQYRSLSTVAAHNPIQQSQLNYDVKEPLDRELSPINFRLLPRIDMFHPLLRFQPIPADALIRCLDWLVQRGVLNKTQGSLYVRRKLSDERTAPLAREFADEYSWSLNHLGLPEIVLFLCNKMPTDKQRAVARLKTLAAKAFELVVMRHRATRELLVTRRLYIDTQRKEQKKRSDRKQAASELMNPKTMTNAHLMDAKTAAANTRIARTDIRDMLSERSRANAAAASASASDAVFSPAASSSRAMPFSLHSD